MDLGNNIISSGQSYIPKNIDRRVLRIRLNVQGEDIVADFNMRAVGFAVNSEMLNSKTDEDFVNINDAKGVTKSNVESVFDRFTKLDAILNGFNNAGNTAGINISGNASTATTATNISGTVAIANGGTGATSAAGARSNLELGSLATVSTNGDNTTYLRGDGVWATISGGGGGALSSVGLSLPNIFTVTGSPLTADGTISATLQNQSANTIFAGPVSGGNAAPTFRSLVASDIPALSHINISGTLSGGQIVDPFVGSGLVVTGLTNTSTAQVLSPCLGVVKSTASAFSCAPLVSADLASNIIQSGHITSGAVTDDKINSVAGSKITGTVPTGTLPVASGSSDGIVNQLTQSFAGAKTFINNLVAQGALTVSGLFTASGGVSTTTVTASGAISSASLSASGNISSSGEVRAATLKVTNGAGAGRFLASDASGNASWQTVTGGARGYQAISANYSVVAGDVGKLFDVTNGSTVTLPNATTVGAGFVVSVKRTGTSDVSIATTLAQTIEGQSSLTLQTQYSGLVLVSTGSGWIIESKYGLNPALLALNPSSLSGVNGVAPANGSCQNITVTNTGQIATSTLSVSVPLNFTKTGCSDTCTGNSLVGGASCTIGVAASGAASNLGAISGLLTVSAGGLPSVFSFLSGTVTDACAGSPTPGTACYGGAIYLGNLSWGSSSVSSGPADRYMTTPGGCGDIPSPTGGSGLTSYTTSDFTPASCSGTDSLVKIWNGGGSNWYDIPNLSNYTTDGGTGYGATNKDNKYGSENAVEIVAITNSGNGGYHAAARYCDKLSYGGYTDWYLPNRYELNLMNTNKASIPGLDVSGNYYWSSTECANSSAWFQRFSDGNQNGRSKSDSNRVRCVRRF